MSFTGDDYDLDRWPPTPHGVSEFEPIHSSRHIDVSKYQRDVYSTFKYYNGLVSVSCLDRNKSRIFYNLNGEQPEKPVVLDDQDNRDGS